MIYQQPVSMTSLENYALGDSMFVQLVTCTDQPKPSNDLNDRKYDYRFKESFHGLDCHVKQLLPGLGCLVKVSFHGLGCRVKQSLPGLGCHIKESFRGLGCHVKESFRVRVCHVKESFHALNCLKVAAEKRQVQSQS